MNVFRTYARQVVTLLASNKFFYAVLMLFVLEAAWIALTGRFPLAFDEDYHMQVIEWHAQQWGPFFAAQPEGTTVYGEMVRNPSMLYHYLMSFPFRLSDWLFHDDVKNILTMRAFSIGFFATGIVLFRRVLLMARASRAMIHAVMLFFVLTPVVPFLAAHANYDNLLFLLAAIVFLLAIPVLRALRQGKIDSIRLLGLTSIAMLAALVKYSFLPFLAGLAVLMLVVAIRGRKQHSYTKLWHSARQHFVRSRRIVQIALMIMFVVSAGMFIRVYGYNIVQYGEPEPSCDKVLTMDQCREFGVWKRNYDHAHFKLSSDANPLPFTYVWGATYLRSFFFAVNGIYSGFVIASPLPVLHILYIVVFWMSLALVVLYRHVLFRNHVYQLFGVLIAVYMVSLWQLNYAGYVRSGQHFGEQGRYVIFLLLPIYLLVAQAVGLLLAKRPVRKVAVVLALFVLFTQGGGALTYIARSDTSWWWKMEDVPLASPLNQTAQPVVRALIIGDEALPAPTVE